MTRVHQLIEQLRTYPADALVYAYEGEETGIVVLSPDGKQIGFIPATDKQTPA